MPPVSSPADGIPRVTGSGTDGQTVVPAAVQRAARQDRPDPPAGPTPGKPPEAEKKQDKKGLLRRLLGVFK
jgi:hypothetical protein